MDTKLTLSLDKEIIGRAKKYAKSQHTSLSKMIESYLALITDAATQKDQKNTISHPHP